MTTLGQFCLLIALVGSGYAAFACLVGWRSGHRALQVGGLVAAWTAVLALTATTVVLAWALLTGDFRFEYVVRYSDRSLPWHYCLSALWVGQAGSLLVWAWFLAVLAMIFRFWPSRESSELRAPAFGVLMAYLFFLTAVMVFSADPMQPSLTVPTRGDGLAPLLQHPAMLVHPPIVFLGYAAWGVPFALALAALLSGRLDATWVKQSRRWALFAWAALGGGILLGAQWAYEELGWGGYWNWDPVENACLIPWLTATALVHCLMAWQYVGMLKKTALALAIATFGLCNFATFLTRSGIFSSLHEFSQSPIGWMFLACMCTLALGGGGLIALRRAALKPEKPITSVRSREALALLGTIMLVLLAAVVLLGTLSLPLSDVLNRPRIAIGAAFYNNVLVPTGLLLLAAAAAVPLLRWGGAPSAAQTKMLGFAAVAAGLVATIAFLLGLRHPIALTVAGLATLSLLTTLGALLLEVRRRQSAASWLRRLRSFAGTRRLFAGLLIHLSFVCLAIGVTGSSLGSRRHELVMAAGETVSWAERSVRYVDLIQRELPDQVVVAARMEVSRAGAAPYTLLPAQRLYRSQNAWTTEVAIHSTWSGDFYMILHGGQARDRVNLTLVEMPMMRWMWLAGWIGAAGALLGLLPTARRTAAPPTGLATGRSVLRGAHRPLTRRHQETAHA